MSEYGSKQLLLVSHLRLRRVLGVLGIALPVVVAVWGFALAGWSLELQDTISDYYGLRTRDAFVGILFVIAWFLFAYKGYEAIDDIAGYLAGAFALGVALFPGSGAEWEKTVHSISAGGLFLVLAFISLFLFTRSHDSPKGLKGTLNTFRFSTSGTSGTWTRQKQRRNRVYVACGLIMVACIVLIWLYTAFLQETAIAEIKPVFWLETLMVWAFGVSWLVKGETLLRDKPAWTGRDRVYTAGHHCTFRRLFMDLQ